MSVEKVFKMPTKVPTFMTKMEKRLVEERGNSPTTAAQTIAQLQKLNGDAPFISLVFLKDTEAIEKKLEGYAESSKGTIYGKINAALSLMKGAQYAVTKKYYQAVAEGKRAELEKEKKERGLEKTEKEEAVWMDWPDVLKRREEIGKVAEALMKSRKPLADKEFVAIQSYALLSLYTLMPPRRNLDYQAMLVVKKPVETMDPGKNYYILSEGKMVFNNYKTAKTHGQQTVHIPEALVAVLKGYLRMTPQWKSTNGKVTEMPLLVNAGGAPLVTSTSVKRLLSLALGNNGGSSMLRHSYLTHKFGAVAEEMSADAAAMAHTVGTQQTYIRASGGAGTDDKIELVGDASSTDSD